MENNALAIITMREELIARESELLSTLKRFESDIQERKKEIVRIEQNITYYTKLVSDMKNEMAPSKMDQVYRAI